MNKVTVSRGLYANQATAIVINDKTNDMQNNTKDDMKFTISDKNGTNLAIVIIGFIKSCKPINIISQPTNLNP